MLEAVPPLLIVAATAALYGVGMRVVRRGRTRGMLPTWRVTSFVAGLLVVAGAVVGPIDHLADDRFSVHMVQHVLLMMVAAPLLAVGAPMTVLLLSLSRKARRKVAGSLLRSRAMRVLLSPVSAFCLFVAVLWGTHYPAIYDAAVSHQALHDLEHLSYLVTAVLLWSVVFGFDFGPTRPDYPGRLLLLFCVMAATSILGLVLTSTPRPLYPYYQRASAEAGVSPLGDQHLGGVIMWVGGMVMVVMAMVPVLLAWLAEDERRAVRSERRAAQRAPTVGG